MKGFIMKFQSDWIFWLGLFLSFLGSVFASWSMMMMIPLLIGWVMVFLHFGSLKLSISEKLNKTKEE